MAKKPDIERIRKHWHASEDVMSLCMHAEGLENEVRRLNLFIRENVPCSCGVGGVPMCKRCMITDGGKGPEIGAPVKLKSICTCLTCGATWKPTRKPTPCPFCSKKKKQRLVLALRFRYCTKCGMDLLKDWDKHGAYCTFKVGQFAKK
jgi:hypothetical protein